MLHDSRDLCGQAGSGQDLSGPGTSFRISADTRPGDQLQIVGEATDDAALPLTPYMKLVVHVEQAQARR
jgi:hypothetical protein